MIKSKIGSYPSQVKHLFQCKPTFKWVRKMRARETSLSGIGSGLGAGQVADCSARLSASPMVLPATLDGATDAQIILEGLVDVLSSTGDHPYTAKPPGAQSQHLSLPSPSDFAG